jgi:eukaryotic-like serine/threonine-protein kinase
MAAFGKYEVVELIGQGGFGRVYKAFDPTLKRHVAVKTCTLQDAEMKQRFEREAEIAAKLRHPHIVTVYDYGHQDGEPYLVQEYLEGEDLDHKLKRGDVIPVGQLMEWLRQAAEGLEYAHRHGVLHRDVKPANIRVLPDGEVRIMDFGIAKLLEEERQLTRTGMSIGTSGYLAPETLSGGPVDHRADIFSFGVMAYEVVAQRRPFEAESFTAVLYRILHEEPTPLAAVAPSCDPRLIALIERCLSKDPNGRYASFADVAADLRAIAGAPQTPVGLRMAGAAAPAGVAHGGPPPPAAAEAPRRRIPAAAWALIAATIAVAGFGVLNASRPGSSAPAPPSQEPVPSAAGPDADADPDDPSAAAAAAAGGAADIGAGGSPAAAEPGAGRTPGTVTGTTARDAAGAGARETSPAASEAPPAPPAGGAPLVAHRVVVLVGGAVAELIDAAETVLLNELRSAGFEVRDAALAAGAGPAPAGTVLRAGTAAGAGVVLVADVSAAARPIVTGMYSGSAAVAVRLYGTAEGTLLASERFEIGTARVPGEPGPTELAAATAAVKAAAYQAARGIVMRLRQP